MAELSDNTKRLTRNTLLLYVRMFVVMLVTLFTSRVVLRTLGVVDFGIHNVVGGFVAMFSLISAALAAAVSRFLNIEMGRGDARRLREVFSAAFYIHLILAVVIIICAEVVGPWFIAHKMTIPPERIDAAGWVLHATVAILAINLVELPFNACIIARENMKVYAYVSLVEVFANLGAVYMLSFFDIDKLVLYAWMLLAVCVVVKSVYVLYSLRFYPESRLLRLWDRRLMGEIMAFAGWNMVGSSSVVIADQGVNILLNQFFNPVVNAARGIAMQVNVAVNAFAQNFMVALNPQITKCYGAHDMSRYAMLILNGARLCSCLIILLSLPLLLETDYVLRLWLGEVPDYTLHFVRLVLLFSISESFTYTLTTGILATGRIRRLQLTVGLMRMMNLPLSYVLLRMGCQPELTFVVAIIVSQVNLFIRLRLVQEHVSLPIGRFYLHVVVRTLAVAAMVFLCLAAAQSRMPEGALRLVVVTALSFSLFGAAAFAVVLSSDERSLLVGLIKKYLHRT